MTDIPENLNEIRDRLDLEPYDAELHQALGRGLLKDGNLGAARDAYERSIVLDPADPWSYLYLGNLFYWQQDYRQAIEQFQHARQRGPELAIVHVCIADAYHGLGEFALAKQYYERAVEVDPNDQNAAKNLRRWQKITKDRKDHLK
jgi:tetratricopeptide (TPR) repeat protein